MGLFKEVERGFKGIVMVEVIGYVGGFLFAFCGLPQAYLCYKDGHAKGVSSGLLWMWLSGEVLVQAYVILKHGFDMPLLINYWVNTVFVSVIIKYKYWERK